jgi:hypothetical protein
MEHFIISTLLIIVAIYVCLIIANRSDEKLPSVQSPAPGQAESSGLSLLPNQTGDQTMTQASVQGPTPVQADLPPAASPSATAEPSSQVTTAKPHSPATTVKPSLPKQSPAGKPNSPATTAQSPSGKPNSPATTAESSLPKPSPAAKTHSPATTAKPSLPKQSPAGKPHFGTSFSMDTSEALKPPVLSDLEGDLDVDGVNRHSLDKRRNTVVSSTFYLGTPIRVSNPEISKLKMSSAY